MQSVLDFAFAYHEFILVYSIVAGFLGIAFIVYEDNYYWYPVDLEAARIAHSNGYPMTRAQERAWNRSMKRQVA